MDAGSTTFPAFKEWAPIVAALGAGRQIILLRKGGIAEGRGGFKALHTRFWLFPTLFHPDPSKLKEHCLTSLENPGTASRAITLEWVAEAVDHRFLTNWEEVARLDTHHGWTESTVRERFVWAEPAGIHLFVLKVFKSNSPLVLEPSPQWGGCKSWLEVPTRPDASGLTPVLSEADFAARVAQLPLAKHA